MQRPQVHTQIVWPRNCFFVMKGLSCWSRVISLHLTSSVNSIFLLCPFPHPLSLFWTTSSLFFSTGILSHSSVLLVFANQDRTAFRDAWHFLHLLSVHLDPPAATDSETVITCSQSTHLSRLGDQWSGRVIEVPMAHLSLTTYFAKWGTLCHQHLQVLYQKLLQSHIAIHCRYSTYPNTKAVFVLPTDCKMQPG